MEKKPKSKEQSKEEVNREIARMALNQTVKRVNENQLQFNFKDKNDG